MPWGPVVGGAPAALDSSPLDSIKRGDMAKVPVILGTNEDEGSIFLLGGAQFVPGCFVPLTGTPQLCGVWRAPYSSHE